MNCEIGGFCGGGCFLSCKNDKNRFCKEEKESFSYFVQNYIKPIIKEKINTTMQKSV
jgi:uncharacterized protein